MNSNKTVFLLIKSTTQITSVITNIRSIPKISGSVKAVRSLPPNSVPPKNSINSNMGLMTLIFHTKGSEKKGEFENFTDSTFADIDVKIREQVSIYLPVVRIIDLQFLSSQTDENTLSVRIEFSIPDIASRDLLEFTI